MKKLILLVPLFLLLVATPALARNGGSALPTKASQVAQTKLASKQLLACQAKEAAVTKQMDQLNKMSLNMLDTFDKIALKVKTYYDTKVVPSGATVANYAALSSDIVVKRAAVQTALTTAQTASSGFTCVADNPKGLLTQFKTSMQGVKTALKEYRTSINKLIVAVRTSAKPSVTPTASPTSAE